MTSDIINSLLQRVNQPDLLRILSQDLSGTELNSLLMEVFRNRTQSLTAPQLLNLYQQNRFVKPADLPVVEMKKTELEVLQLFERHSFKAIDLAPVTELGACSIVGPTDQKKILSALRGTEVLADSTNAIALHIADLKQGKRWSDGVLRFCNIQRQVRTQALSIKGFTPHFRVGCLVSCGADTGAFAFERINLEEHLQLLKILFLEYYRVDELAVRLMQRPGYNSDLIGTIAKYLRDNNPGLSISIITQNSNNTGGYYKGLQFKVDIIYRGKTYEIADGGFVDWTQQLLQNKKERMLTSGFGFDLMHRILSGEV
jgi:hypothetical protein